MYIELERKKLTQRGQFRVPIGGAQAGANAWRAVEGVMADRADLKKTKEQVHEHLCYTGMPVRNGNLRTDRTNTTTKAASVRKQPGTKNSKSNEYRQENNGGDKG